MLAKDVLMAALLVRRDHPLVIPAYESDCCDALEQYFEVFSPERELSRDHVHFVVDCFKGRWARLVESGGLLVARSVAIHEHWYRLSEPLVSFAQKKGYLSSLSSRGMLIPITVARVLKFIRDVQASHFDYDQVFAQRLSDCFSSRKDSDILTKSELQCIDECYKERWQKIANTPRDYLHNPTGANKAWVDFSREVALLLRKDYIGLLVSTAKNQKDPNDSEHISRTIYPQDAYLDDAGNLCRKKALFDLIVSKNYQLLTHRSHTIEGVVLPCTSLSVSELARLRLSFTRDMAGPESYSHFADFWDFLEWDVLSRGQKTPADVSAILPHLVNLIQKYQELKVAGTGFQVFKALVSVFITFLSSQELEKVNFFYSIWVRLENARSGFLLDFLIDMYVAQDYTLDRDMQLLGKVFSTQQKKPDTTYCLGPKTECLGKPPSSTQQKRPDTSSYFEADDLDGPMFGLVTSVSSAFTAASLGQGKSTSEVCCRLIVSIFSYGFFSKLGEEQLYFCDEWVNVPLQLAQVYGRLYPSIENNDLKTLSEEYAHALRYLSSELRRESGFFGGTKDSKLSTWIHNVLLDSLDKLGIYCFHPAVLLDALMGKTPKLYIEKPDFWKRSIGFLDELVRTYAGSTRIEEHNLLKIYRVNIHFFALMSRLEKDYQELILSRLLSPNLAPARDRFFANCVEYLGVRMCEVAGIPGLRQDQINDVAKLKELQSLLPQGGFISFCSILKASNREIGPYSSAQFMGTKRDSASELKKMKGYLEKLNKPIRNLGLSHEEEAISMRRGPDPLGWWS